MTERDVEEITRLVARHGLNGHAEDRPSGPIEDDDWLNVRGALLNGCLSGLAIAAVEDESLGVTPEQSADLVDLHRERMTRALLLERVLVDVSAALEARGVPALVLKGSSFAHTAYPDPGWRDFNDIDLLVPTPLFAEAGRVLRELGAKETFSPPRPGFVERFGKAAVFQVDPFEIDLHRTLMFGPYGVWVDADRLFAEHATFPLGGRSLRCLSPEHRLIHACMHAVLGHYPPMLLPLRDAAEIERAGGLDADKLARDARSWRVESVLARAATELRVRLGVEPGPLLSAFDTVEPGRQERAALRSYLDAGHADGRTSTSMIRVLPGVRPKLAYLRAVVLPDAGFLEQQGGTKVSRVRGYLMRWRRLLGILWRRRKSRVDVGDR